MAMDPLHQGPSYWDLLIDTSFFPPKTSVSGHMDSCCEGGRKGGGEGEVIR